MFNLIKTIMGMQLGHLLLIGGGFIIGLSIIKNIFTGSFSVGKFLGGFNFFAGGVQGKLIYYGLIIFACFTVYHFVMRSTYSYDTDYKNHIHHNADVFTDQRVGTQEGCAFEFGFGLIKLGCKSQPMTKTINYECESCKEVKEVK